MGGNSNGGGQGPFHAHAGHQKHQMGPHGGMLPGHGGGISAGRGGQAGNAQAAAAAAAIAAVAAQGAPGGPEGPATDSQGNILPLSRLQEIWSR
jgi:hypothetical protein